MTATSRNPFSSDWVGDAGRDRLRPPGPRSYVSGAGDDPLRYRTLGRQLDRAAERFGARDAAVFPEAARREYERLSWHDLKRRSDDVAAALLALGIRRGNRVGIWAPNRAEWLLTQFGTARIGAVLVNVNPAYREAELEHALNKVRCRALVVARSHRGSDYLGMLRSLAPELERHADDPTLESARLPHLKHVVVLGEGPVPPRAIRFEDLVRMPGPAQYARLPGVEAALDPDDTINIQFTSGTTGTPKAAMLTHFGIVNNARLAARTMRLTEKDRLCIPVPLYHCFGMVLGVLACAATGAAMVFPGESFDAARTLEVVARERCTALHGVPTMMVAMLEHPEFRHHDLSTLRTGIMAGAPCPVEVMRRVIADMHMREVTIAYGMTETSPVTFQTSVDDPLERRVGTVGRVHPHVEAKVVDAEGRIVPLGTPGELCTRGYGVMRGYFDDPEASAEAVDRAGWMHTGDLAVLDADGYCNIVGRLKDMLIRGGENLYPREIEEFIATHPGVASVQVFGVPDARNGEEACAWIVARSEGALDEATIRAHCAGRIASYKIPRYIRFVTEYPMTVTGKVRKQAMRQTMMHELGLSEPKTA